MLMHRATPEHHTDLSLDITGINILLYYFEAFLAAFAAFFAALAARAFRTF